MIVRLVPGLWEYVCKSCKSGKRKTYSIVIKTIKPARCENPKLWWNNIKLIIGRKQYILTSY